MSPSRLALFALVCLASAAHGRSSRGSLADVLADGVSRLWRPWSRQDPSRGPDRTGIIRSISTDPSRLDEGLQFAQKRRKFLQQERKFSVVNRAEAARRREDGQWGARQERRWERPEQRGAGGWGAERRADRRQERRWERPARQQNSRREGRLLPLLTLIRFEHFTCNASTGANGTCYTASECSGLGGVATGGCADDYGVCCVFTKSCGDRITMNNTYFVNENYPGPYDGTSSCQIHIDKVDDNICQFRLDFDSFTLAQPERLNHICMNDQFSVTGSSSMPLICGANTGNHMYVDAAGGRANSLTTLNIVTSGPSFARSWKIRVSQIPCGATYTAEPACLQYHTGVKGVIKSYNFDFNNGAELANQDYTACVRVERNFCGIQYRPCDDPVNNSSQSFSLGGGDTAVGALTGDSCARDWVFVPCLTDNVNQPLTNMSDGNACVDRVCGDRFNSIQGTDSLDVPLYSFVKPFRLTYHTDSEEAQSTTSEANNRGFCLDYVQQPCTS